MSVLQCGDCLNIFIFHLSETLFANILIAITRNLSGNRSQTPISSYKMNNGGCTVPTYPLRVYSEIPMTRIARGQRNVDRSHSLVVTSHNNPQESESELYQHACKCV